VKGQHDLDDQQRAALKSRLADVHASFEQPEQSIVLRHTCRMEQPSVDTPRVATVPEAATVARLLDTFNRDYDTPTPGTAVLATRLGRLLAGGDDTDARRFYERHGYVNSEPGEDQPLLYYYRELGDAS